MKNSFVLFAFILLGGLCFSSCDKDEIAARKTAYFFTENDSETSELLLYINGTLIGQLPVVPGGIANCEGRSKAIEKKLDLGKSTVEVKRTVDGSEEVVMEMDLEVAKNGRQVENLGSRRGDAHISSFQGSDLGTCLLIELSE